MSRSGARRGDSFWEFPGRETVSPDSLERGRKEVQVPVKEKVTERTESSRIRKWYNNH